MKLSQVYLATFFAGFALLLGGCSSSSFEHDWEAAATMKPDTATDITGRWQGAWKSEANGHDGGLRCLIARVDKTTYHAKYAATFWTIFHFSYEMDLTARPSPEWVTFEGAADLGALAGGVYHYDGHANAESFFANYRSSDDRGTFTMKRP